MIKIKPFLHKGTRDFLPAEVIKRNYIFNCIKHYFNLYGFAQIETPAIERLEILTGKYGEEGDKLLFKILNSGDYLQKIDWAEMSNDAGDGSMYNYKKLTGKITEKGLRYDLTVPLARYVVMNQNDLIFPFRRFHIGPVWRADRPGKGRFQEFYQCDADIIGTTSLLCELDLTNMIIDVFDALGMKVTLKLNNRKILEGIANVCGFRSDMGRIITIIDKLDKIGMEGVEAELSKEAILAGDVLSRLMNTLKITALEELENILKEDSIGKQGVEELKFIFDKVKHPNVIFDVTLARGLDYYTGCIFEAVSNDVAMGSILGGGRYDNLTEVFGGKDMSGVGISFGIERIYEIMTELNLFPEITAGKVKVLVCQIEPRAINLSLALIHELRENNISAELYPNETKLEKQLKYANGKNIQYAVIIGSKEMDSNVLTVKDMGSGEQKSITSAELVNIINQN
jgi:histidyl-tRNA synthetase